MSAYKSRSDTSATPAELAPIVHLSGLLRNPW